MKNSKRRLLSLALVLILILSTTILSGCYITRSAKMKYVEGTYELTTYSGDSDWLAERQMKLIMVIRSDGTGYYAYKDHDTEPFVAELRCKFTTDPDDSKKYEYVEIDFQGNGEYHKLAVNSTWSHQNLNSQRAKFDGFNIDYHINVDFTRVDKATDNSYIIENFGAHDVLPFGAIRFSHNYELNEDESVLPDELNDDHPYVYFYMELNVIARKLKLWYMLKQDEVACIEEHELEVIRDGSGEYFFRVDGVKVVPDSSHAPYGYTLKVANTDGTYMKFAIIGDWDEEYLNNQINIKYQAFSTDKLLKDIESSIKGLLNSDASAPDPSKYSPEIFASIDANIALYIAKYHMHQNSINYELLEMYKDARLYYLIEEAKANVEAAYLLSTNPLKDMLRSTCLNNIAAAADKSYSFSAMHECPLDVSCDGCDEGTYVLVEDVATEGLKVFTTEYCNNVFGIIE